MRVRKRFELIIDFTSRLNTKGVLYWVEVVNNDSENVFETDYDSDATE